MKDYKTEFRFFTIMQYEDEARYLEERHKEGWKLVKVYIPGIYRFEKCTPKDTVYQLDYNQDGIQHKSEYVKMFEDCGWEYLFDFVGYSYFRKPVSQMQGKEEIFCDDESRLDMMKRVFRGRMVPLIVIFFCAIIPQIIIQSLLNGFLSPFPITFAVIMVAYIIIFLHYTCNYISFKKKVGK